MIENLRPYDVEYLSSLSQDQLREFALEHTPCTAVTAQGNLNKVSRNKARMAKHTYVIAPESDIDHFYLGKAKELFQGLTSGRASFAAASESDIQPDNISGSDFRGLRSRMLSNAFASC